MSVSLKKFYSLESGEFNKSRSVCHFEIPRQGIYDLSQSYLVLPVEIETDTNGVYNVGLRYRTNCLVKNARIECEKLGIMEDIQNINVLNATLDRYIYSKNESNSFAWNQGSQEVGDDGNFYTCFRELNVSSSSKNLRPELYIKLNELFKGIAQLRNYTASALGKTTITLEFEDETRKDVLQENIRYYSATDREEITFDGQTEKDELVTQDDMTVEEVQAKGYEEGGKYWFSTDGIPSVQYTIETIQADGDKVRIITTEEILDNDTGVVTVMWRLSRRALELVGTDEKKELVTRDEYLSPSDVGFFVDQRVSLMRIEGVAEINKITKVEQDDDYVKITFENDVTDNDVNLSYGMYPENTDDLSYKIFDPVLQIVEVLPTSQSVVQLQKALKSGIDTVYKTWQVERFNLQGGQTQFNRMFYLDPVCDRTVLLNNRSDELESSLWYFKDYRTQLNGVDTTNKNVVYDTALYKDRIMSKFPKNVKNLKHHRFIIPESIPISNEKQSYQVQLNSNGVNFEDSQLFLFKRVEKLLTL